MLAHGGSAGALAEALFVFVPIAVFAALARKARHQREREEAEASEVDVGPDAETAAP